MNTNLPGSNQFVEKRRFLKKGTYKSIALASSVAMLMVGFSIGSRWFWTHYDIQSPIVIHMQPIIVPVKLKLVSPMSTQSASLIQKAYAEEQQTPRFTTAEQQETADYIVKVFGEEAPRAFTLLSCENSKLNRNAINTAGNSPVGSRDMGVFQINEYWQGVQGKFLLNWKVNIEIAHQIFVDNGHTFNVWTCGRKLGV